MPWSEEKKKQYRRDHYRKNREAYRAKASKYYRDHPEKCKQWSRDKRLRGYGITEQDRQELIWSQAGLCAICCLVMSPSDMAVDHDHETGSVRGIVHRKCNAGIGMLQENALIVRSAAEYMEANR